MRTQPQFHIRLRLWLLNTDQDTRARACDDRSSNRGDRAGYKRRIGGSTPFPRTVGLRLRTSDSGCPAVAASLACETVRCNRARRHGPRRCCGGAAGSRPCARQPKDPSVAALSPQWPTALMLHGRSWPSGTASDPGGCLSPSPRPSCCTGRAPRTATASLWRYGCR